MAIGQGFTTVTRVADGGRGRRRSPTAARSTSRAWCYEAASTVNGKPWCSPGSPIIRNGRSTSIRSILRIVREGMALSHAGRAPRHDALCGDAGDADRRQDGNSRVQPDRARRCRARRRARRTAGSSPSPRSTTRRLPMVGLLRVQRPATWRPAPAGEIAAGLGRDLAGRSTTAIAAAVCEQSTLSDEENARLFREIRARSPE